MGTGRGTRSARGTASAQDAPKAPRMALAGLSGAGATSEASCGRKPVLGHPWKSGKVLAAGSVDETRSGGSEGSLESPIAERTVPRTSGRIAGTSPAQQPSIYRPEPLSWPERAVHDTSIDDLDRHLAARGRLNRLVGDLCRKYRREFPAYKYAVTTEGSHREVAALLSLYGGLPEGSRLNDAPAEVLEKAVEAFAAYFGLEGDDRPSGRPALLATQLDPAPRTRKEPEAAPW